MTALVIVCVAVFIAAVAVNVATGVARAKRHRRDRPATRQEARDLLRASADRDSHRDARPLAGTGPRPLTAPRSK